MAVRKLLLLASFFLLAVGNVSADAPPGEDSAGRLPSGNSQPCNNCLDPAERVHHVTHPDDPHPGGEGGGGHVDDGGPVGGGGGHPNAQSKRGNAKAKRGAAPK